MGSSIVRVQLLGNNEAEMSAIRAPCVFRADEEELHKYAAILAATEPFRSLCNTQIKKAMNPIDYIIRWLSGSYLKEVFSIPVFVSKVTHLPTLKLYREASFKPCINNSS